MTRCITDLTCNNVKGMDDDKTTPARRLGRAGQSHATKPYCMQETNRKNRAAQAGTRRPAAYTPMNASTFAAATRFSDTSRSGSTPASP